MNASRTQKSIHNSLIALIYYAIGLLLSFFSRKIFLEFLGTDILGLNTTAQNLLQLLNLTELGIGSAIGFSLYKPIQDNDKEKINEIVTLQGNLYKRIGFIVLIGALIMMGFFPWIFKKMELPLWYAYISFGAFLYSALLSYFINYKQILLSAHQQNYKILYSYRTVILLKIVAQMIAVYWLSNGFLWWIILEVFFATVASVCLHKVTIKSYPNFQKSNSKYKILKEKYHYIVVKVKQLFFHKIGGYVLTQSSPLIIYAYIDLNEVALYGNYMIIISGIQIMIGALFNSMDAGVGNLIAEGEKNKIQSVFQEIFSIRFIIASTLSLGVLLFSQSFISLWIGTKYLLPMSTLFLLVLNLFIQLTRYTVEAFLNGYGQFSDIWSPIAEASINIGLSILLGYFFGLNGIILGVLISQIIIIVLWKPFFLIKKNLLGFGRTYVTMYLNHLEIACLIGVFLWFFLHDMIDSNSTNYFKLFSIALLIIAFYICAVTAILYFYSIGTNMAVNRFKKLLLRKK